MPPWPWVLSVSTWKCRGAERSYETVQEIESPRVPCCQIWIVVLGIEQQAQRYDNHHIYHGIPDSGCAFTAYGQQDCRYYDRQRRKREQYVYYRFSHLSSQLKYVLCQSIPFCGLSTQWFSSGNSSSSAGTPLSLAAWNADTACE